MAIAAALVALAGCEESFDPTLTVTMVSVGSAGTGGLAAGDGQYVYASWASSKAYGDVTIEALLGPWTPGTGTAWLTSTIGPGTTAGSELYSASFEEPAFGSSPDFVILFDNMSLPAGQFYLILSGPGDASWEPGDAGAITIGRGITAPQTGVVNSGWGSPPYDASYPPASTFSIHSSRTTPALRITGKRLE